VIGKNQGRERAGVAGTLGEFCAPYLVSKKNKVLFVLIFFLSFIHFVFVVDLQHTTHNNPAWVMHVET
jgi:hypothetical protein